MIGKIPNPKLRKSIIYHKNKLDNCCYAIVFDTEKHKLIIKELPQLEFMVEDNKQIADEVGSWGYNCFLMDNIYNQGKLGENVFRVRDFEDILRVLGGYNG